RWRAAFLASNRSGLGEGLFDIGNDVIDMLDADRDAHQVFRYAGLFQLFGRKLAMGGGGRVAGQRLGVTDIDEAQDHLQRIDEAPAGFLAALDAKGEDARAASL